jgi:hypothetical protein
MKRSWSSNSLFHSPQEVMAKVKLLNNVKKERVYSILYLFTYFFSIYLVYETLCS